MFSRFKRKGAKAPEKFEFRFQFRASGVPVSGYDRLLVCVVPFGKAKSAAKTQKAPVRNGSVSWSETVGVRVKLSREKKGAPFDVAVYKFVVSSANSRSGVLGEASINLADCVDYVQKEKSFTLMNGSVAAGTALHTTVTCTRVGPSRDGVDSASSADDDAYSEDDQSQDYSESISESGQGVGDLEQAMPLRIKVPVRISDEARGSRFSQATLDEAPVSQRPVLQPTRPTGRDARSRGYDAYALNGEARNSAPTMAPILIANQPDPLLGPGGVLSRGGLAAPRGSELRGSGSFLPLAQTGSSRGSYAEADDFDNNGDYDSPSRSFRSFSGGSQQDRRDTPERRHSLGGAVDPLSVVPPRGKRDFQFPKPNKVKELAAQFREKELGGSMSPGDAPPGGTAQPRYQVATDRYVGRGLDQREMPYSGRGSLDSSASSISQRGEEGATSHRGEAPPLDGDFSKARHWGGEAGMLSELERMEVEIEGLRAQSESWQRSAKNYAAENEQLRGEMKVQIQYTDEAGAEADEAARERDELKLELEKMRDVMQLSTDREDRQATAQWEMDDARRHTEELEEELEQQKEQIEALRLQLEKIHESNQMLVEEVKDFEEQDELRDAELEDLRKQVADLEAELQTKEGSGAPSELTARITALEDENRTLLARLEEADPDKIRTLQERVEELEAEASELTEESMKLAGDLTNAQSEVKQREARVVELERALQLEQERSADLGTVRSLEEELSAAQGTIADLEAKLQEVNDVSQEEEVAAAQEEVRALQADLNAAKEQGSKKATAGKASEMAQDSVAMLKTVQELEGELEAAQGRIRHLEDRSNKSAAPGETAQELEAALKAVQELEAELEMANETIRHLEGGEEVAELREMVKMMTVDLASAREGRDSVTRQYDRLKQLLEEDNSEERIEDLEKEVQELQSRLAASSAKPSEDSGKAHADLLAQIKLLEAAREALTGQLASQAQEARSARLELETRLEKTELEKTQAQEKSKSLEAELQVSRGSGSAEKDQDAVVAFKGSLQEAAAQSQQRLDASLARVHELEEELNRQRFLVSKAEGAAFEARERYKLAQLEFSDKSKTMVEKLAALEEELEQVKSEKKGLETKHVLTLRGLEMRHGEREQELQRKHLAEWGQLHAAKEELEAKHEETSELKTGLEKRVSELEKERAEIEAGLSAERARLTDQVSGEKQQYEEKIEGLEAQMASITAQLNESLRVETEMANEYAGKEKALRDEVKKLEERVKELSAEVSEHARKTETVQKVSEESGKEGQEKLRALQSQLDEVVLEMKYKDEENEELNARIEELHALVEDSQAQADEFKTRAEGLAAELGEKVTDLNGQLAKLEEERDSHKETAGTLLEEVETHKSKGLELAALLEEHKEQLAVHQEKAGNLTKELETTTATKSSAVAEQAALLKKSQQKVKSLEAQVAKLTAQIEDQAAAKEASHRRMSFAMQEGALASAKVQDLEEVVERLTEEMEGHVAEKEEVKGQLASAEAAKSEVEVSLQELRQTHESLGEVKNRLETEHEELRGKHEELTASRDLVVKQHEEAARGVEGLRKEVSRLTTDLETQNGRCGKLEGSRLEAESLVKELEGRVKELESENQTLTKELETVREELEEHQAAKTGLETNLKQLVNDHKGQVGELAAQVGLLTSQLHQQSSSKKEVEARASDLHTERSELQEKFSESEQARKGALERVAMLTQELTSLRLGAGSSAKESQETVAKLGKKIEELENAKSSLTGELDTVRKHALELESEVKGLREQLAKAEAACKEVMGNKAALTAELSALRAKSQKEEEESLEKIQGLSVEKESLGEKVKGLSSEKESLGAEVETLKMELARSQADKLAAVERLEEEMRVLHEQFKAGASDKDKMASEALMSATAVRAEKAELEERLRKHADDEQLLQGAVSELEKRVKELDHDLSAAQKREGELEEQVKLLEAELKAAVEGLRREKLGAAEKARIWEGEREKLAKGLEEAVRKAEREAAEMEKKMELERREFERSFMGLKAETSGKERGWKGDAEKWEAQREKLEGSLKESAAVVAELTATKEALEVRGKELGERCTALEKSVEGLMQEKSALIAKVGSLEKESGARGERIKILEAELEKKSSEFGQTSSGLQSSISELEKLKAALSTQVETLTASLEQEAKARKGVESEIDAAQSGLREVTESLTLLKQELARAEAEKRKLEADHHDSNKELRELVKEKRSLEAKVTDLEKERTVLSAQVEDLTVQLSKSSGEFQKVQEQREALEKDLQSAVQSQKEMASEHSSKVRALEVAAAAAATAAAAERAALQKEHHSLRSELGTKDADVSKSAAELAQHRSDLEAARGTAEATGREFAEHRTKSASEMERLRSDLEGRAADVARLTADVAKLSDELARAREGLATAVKDRTTGERQLAESAAEMKAKLAEAEKEKKAAVEELEVEIAKLREQMTSSVQESTSGLQKEIEGLKKSVEAEKANARRLAMQAANSASAEADELRDENFELKHRLIELETEMKTVGGARRFSAGGAPREEGNALAELRMKVTMLETELQTKTEQLVASERRLQEAREEGIISPGQRPGLLRVGSVSRGIASPTGAVPELLVSPSGRSLLSPGTRRTLAQSKNGRSNAAGDRPESPGGPSSPGALEAKRADLQHRVQALEGDLKKVIGLLEKAKKEAVEKERGLLLEVERLQAANEQLAQGGFDLGMDQLRSELLRLQNQNAALMRSERELQMQLGQQELLEEEVLRLQEANDDLFQKISLYRQYGERAKTVERLHTLEMELQEAMEANLMYKEQLKAALSTHQNVSQAAFSNMGGDMDMILDELKTKKQQARRLETELAEMQGRYTSLSLRCAEVEAQREELVQELKSMKGRGHIKKPSR